MARTNRKSATEELRKQANSIFPAPEIIAPQPAQYGLYGNAYAGAQQARTQDPYFGGAVTSALGVHALAEEMQYAKELEATRQAQLEAQKTAAYYGLLDRTMRDAADVPIGTYNVTQREDGQYGILTDPVLAAAENAMAFDERAAESYGTRAGGIKNVADAGFAPTPEEVGMLLRNPLESPENAVKYGVYETPAVAVERYGKDQGMTVEQQFSLEELKQAGALERAMASAQAGSGKWKAVINPDDGTVSYTFTGTPDELTAQGLPSPVNPKAGARAPGASATKGSVTPVANAVPIAKQLFPMIQITDSKRDPNSRLGRANPDSWHNRTNAAIDSRRIPGMTFDQYVNTYRNAGYEIIEARDEYKNPSAHATGKHWHIVLGQRRNAPARTQQAKSEPPVRLDRITAIMRNAQRRGGTVEQVGNNIVITAPDGRKRTYDANGNVISG